MTQLSQKRILVVGATGVLGSIFARQLVSLGANVVATASAPESAHRLPHSVSETYYLDLANEASIERLASELVSNGEIDGVILASGLVAFGSIADTPTHIFKRLQQVNFTGQAQLISKLVPSLEISAQQSHSPFIVSISGVISEIPMAGLAAYSASKTALHGFATAAARELRRTGVRWIDARPGHTETGLASRAIYGQAPAFGVGLQPEAVVTRIVEAIVNDEKDLPSTAFTS